MATLLQAASLKSLFAALLYGFISISITFFNKAVLSKFHFEYPNFMSLFQMIASLILLEAMRLTGQIHYPPASLHHAKHTAPLALSFVGMVLTGLAALKYLNIPMYNSLRRITTLFTMVGEYYLLNLRESNRVYISVFVMIAGAMISGVTDLNYNAIGYFLVFLNCIFTALYLLFIAKHGKMGLNSFGLMYYNNVLSLPVVIGICVYNNDFVEVWHNFPDLFKPSFVICFLFQSVLAFLLNYSIFLCTQVNSALTTSVTGQIKNIATTAVGFVTFSDGQKYDMYNVISIAIGVWSSGWYSWIKYQESELKSRSKSILPSVNDKLIDLTQQSDMEHNKGHKESMLTSLTAAIAPDSNVMNGNTYTSVSQSQSQYSSPQQPMSSAAQYRRGGQAPPQPSDQQGYAYSQPQMYSQPYVPPAR